MIFVTTGTQLPFDRFIAAVDEVASHYPSTEFLVQAADLQYKVKSTNMQLLEHLTPAAFIQTTNEAELVISHAGIGTILSAAHSAKPLIVFPRFGKLKEHRNDHQVATCAAMQRSLPLNVATNAAELKVLVDSYFLGELPLLPVISAYASDELLNSLKDFIEPEPVVSLL